MVAGATAVSVAAKVVPLMACVVPLPLACVVIFEIVILEDAGMSVKWGG